MSFLETAARLLVELGKRPDPPTVFVRTHLDSVDDRLFRLLLDRPNLTVIHVERRSHAAAMGGGEASVSPSAKAVATLTQTGFIVPVELGLGRIDLSALKECCEQWNIINRGSGLILACEPTEVDARQFADGLIGVYEAGFLPADRLAPMSGFIASLGGQRSRLPFPTMYFGSASGCATAIPPDAGGCRWRNLAGHVCAAFPSADENWECLLAEAVYPYLLGSIASETLGKARERARSAGLRLRATASQGRLAFVAEPVSPIAPAPRGRRAVGQDGLQATAGPAASQPQSPAAEIGGNQP